VAVIWADGGEHIARHNVTVAQANEALADPNAVVIDPDYASKTGRSIRTIGYSPSFGYILTVITVAHQGAVYGATAFQADRRDRRYYEERKCEQ
jgi:uncharacterized DUF497 family protein